MKSSIKALILFVALSVIAISCAKEASFPTDKNNDGLIELTLIANNPNVDVASRTEMNGSTPYWSVGDTIGVSNGTNSNNAFGTNITQASTKASFSGSTVTGTLFAYYPYSKAGVETVSSLSATGAKVDIPAVQNPTPTSFDGSADIMVAKSFTVTESTQTVEDLQFARLGAIIKIVLKDNGGIMASDQHPSFVSLTAESNLVGRVIVDMQNQTMTDPYYNTSKTVTAEYTDDTHFVIDNINGAYLIVAPQILEAGTTISISASTEDYNILKSITVPASGINLLPGKVTTLNIGLSDQQITAKSNATPYSLFSGTIEEGDYLIVYDGKAMKASVNSNRLEYTSVTPTDDIIYDPDEDLIWHIAPSGDYWTIYNASKGKFAASTGAKNQAQLLASGEDDKSLWIVSGTYDFVNKKNNDAEVNANLRNNGTYGFACYGTATGGALSLYKFDDPRQDPSMSWSANSATASWNTGNTVGDFTAPTLSVGDATSITYESTNTEVATVTSAGLVEVVGPGETLIKAIFAGNATYKPQTVSYTLTVTDNRDQVAVPVIYPDASNTVASGTEVTITCTTEGATIYYTLDGTTPTSESESYSGGITLTSSKTVKAIAVKTGYKDSGIATANYTVGVVNTSTEDNPYTPEQADELAGQLASDGTLEGVYVSGIISKITTEYNSQYENVSFNISADGLTSSTQFMIFRAPATSAEDFKVGDAVEFMGTLKNFNGNTHELDAGAALISQLRAPVFTPNGGAFIDSQSVTISADEGSTIYYSIDGSEPSTSYVSAINLTETTTIKAKAAKGSLTTGIVSATFTKNDGSEKTYQHVFKTKPSIGVNTLSGVSWNIAAENLNNYNSSNYAGVQIGTSSKNGSITLTSSSNWAYEGATTIKEVRLWLNLGGTSVTPTVTIGGKSAISDGTVVVKNNSAGSDWTKTTKVTFTPASEGNTGVVVINVSSVKAGYICAIEIDCE